MLIHKAFIIILRQLHLLNNFHPIINSWSHKNDTDIINTIIKGCNSSTVLLYGDIFSSRIIDVPSYIKNGKSHFY